MTGEDVLGFIEVGLFLLALSIIRVVFWRKQRKLNAPDHTRA